MTSDPGSRRDQATTAGGETAAPASEGKAQRRQAEQALRRQRLAGALRENLRRRKAQGRGRDTDETGGGSGPA